MFAPQVRTDGFPRLSAVRGLEQKIRRVIKDVRVDRRKKYRLRAVRAVFRIGCGNRRHVLELPGG